MSRLSPYASEASKNPEIMVFFQNTFDELDSIKKSLNNQMPLTLESKGRFDLHPANSVILAGASKKSQNLFIMQ